MKRREFIAGLGATGWPLLVRAQQQTKPVIAFLGGREAEIIEGLRRGLAEVGFSEGRDVTVEYYTTDGHLDRLPALAADVVRRRPAAILASATPALAAKAVTRNIPIIFGAGVDPVELGLVASLNRPGGNLTGVALLSTEIAEKRLDLLHQAVPTADTIALLSGPADVPYNQVETRQIQSAARALGLRLPVINVTGFSSTSSFATDTEIAPVFATLAEHHAGAVVIAGSLQVGAMRDQIVSLAARFRLPTMFFSAVTRGQGGF